MRQPCSRIPVATFAPLAGVDLRHVFARPWKETNDGATAPRFNTGPPWDTRHCSGAHRAAVAVSRPMRLSPALSPSAAAEDVGVDRPEPLPGRLGCLVGDTLPRRAEASSTVCLCLLRGPGGAGGSAPCASPALFTAGTSSSSAPSLQWNGGAGALRCFAPRTCADPESRCSKSHPMREAACGYAGGMVLAAGSRRSPRLAISLGAAAAKPPETLFCCW